MKTLLINPYTSSSSTAGAYKRFLAPMPPISLAYVAMALREAGKAVSVYDDYIHGGDRALLAEAVEKEKPDAIGLTCVTPTAPRTFDIARFIRESYPDTKIILGNIHASVFYENVLKDNLADYVVLGEGERSVVELVDRLENGQSLEGAEGIAFREKDGTVKATPAMSFVEDLDTMPFPAWDIFPLERYSLFNFAVIQKPGMLILGSRGCPYNCSFCSLKIMGRKRRARTPGNIADEFEWLHDDYGYRQMSFIDPIFPLGKKEGVSFSRELIRRGLEKKIVWTTETRVDLVDQELLDEMAASGLRRIMYGFESGTQTGIDIIQKNFTIEQSRNAVRMTRKAGIQIIGFFMLGVPGDTPSTMDETIKYANSLDIDFAKYTIFSPFPGTRVYEDMIAEGTIPADAPWDSFTNYPSPGRPPVYMPPGVTNSIIMRKQRKAFLSFYLRPKAVFNQLFKVKSLGVKDIINGVRLVLGF